MSCPFVYVNGTLNLVLGNKMVQVSPDHPSYGLIKKSLATATEAELLKMVDVEKSMQDFVEKESKGKAVVSNGNVYFNGKVVHNTISNRILDFMREGLPFAHLLRFMENVALNPSFNSQNELFDFLENKGLPITEDGCFLAYKAIRQDWLDKYSGTISNAIGTVVEVSRGSVDDNRGNECSKGLHCGALDYVYSYGGGDDRIVIVKVNPADAVSVPKDHAFQKLRTCRYEVVSEFVGELKSPLYTAKASEVKDSLSDIVDDWSWCDDYEDEKDTDDGCDCPSCKREDYEDDDDRDDWDDEDDDWDCDEDEDEWDDEHKKKLERSVRESIQKNIDKLGVKPSGQRFYNQRDSKGRFA